jgi:hypothetical protein
MSSIISLNGQFKADIYNNRNELVSEGEYAGNFITSTGLSYPLTMPFVDACRYLSLGSGVQPSHLHTTGLYSGCQPYIYSDNGGFPAKFNFLWTTGIVGSACGYKSNPAGVEIFRGWRIPEVDQTFLEEDLHVAELMTSPAHTGNDGVYTKKGDHFNDIFSGVTAFNRLTQDFTIPSGDYAIITYRLDFGIDSAVRTFDPFVGLNNAAGSSKSAWQALTGVSRVLHPGIRLIQNAAPEGEEGGGEGGEGGEGGGEGSSAGGSYELAYGSPLEPSQTGNLFAYFSSDNTQFRFDQYWGGGAKPGLQKLISPTNGSLHWNNDGLHIASGIPEYFWNFPEVLEDGETEKVTVAKLETVKEWQENPTRADRFNDYRRPKAIYPTSTNVTNEAASAEMGNQGYAEDVTVTSLNHDIAHDYTGQIDYRRDRSVTRVLGWQAINAVADPAIPGTFVKYKSLIFCANNKDNPTTTISELTKSEYAFFDSQFGTYDSVNHVNGKHQGGEHQAIFNSTGEWPYGSNDDKPTYIQPLGTSSAPNICSNSSYTTETTCEAPGVCSDTSYTTKTTCIAASKTWTSSHVWGPKEYPYQDSQNGLSVTWRLSWSAPCGDVPGSCSKYDSHGGVYVTKATCETANGVWTDCVDP